MATPPQAPRDNPGRRSNADANLPAARLVAENGSLPFACSSCESGTCGWTIRRRLDQGDSEIQAWIPTDLLLGRIRNLLRANSCRDTRNDTELEGWNGLNDVLLDEGAAGMALDDLDRRCSGKPMGRCMEYGKSEILEHFIILHSRGHQSGFFNALSRNMSAVALEILVVGQPFGNRLRSFGSVVHFPEHVGFEPRRDQFFRHLQCGLTLHQQIGTQHRQPRGQLRRIRAFLLRPVELIQNRLSRDRPNPPMQYEAGAVDRWAREMNAFREQSRRRRRRSWSPPTWRAAARSPEREKSATASRKRSLRPLPESRRGCAGVGRGDHFRALTDFHERLHVLVADRNQPGR